MSRLEYRNFEYYEVQKVSILIKFILKFQQLALIPDLFTFEYIRWGAKLYYFLKRLQIVRVGKNSISGENEVNISTLKRIISRFFRLYNICSG